MDFYLKIRERVRCFELDNKSAILGVKITFNVPVDVLL